MKKILILLLTTVFLGIFVPASAQYANTQAILHYNKGIDYYKSGLYDKSIAEFRTAINIDPNYIDAYYNLGAVLEYMQQYDAALTVFKQIIVRKPEDYDSVYKAAWISYKLGANDKAKTYLSLIPPNCPRAKEAQDLAAKIEFAMQKSQSKPDLDEVSEPEPEPETNIPQTSGVYENLPSPTGITSDKDGNIYVAEFNTNTIIKITPDNKKIVYLKHSKINGPIGLAIDKSQNMYIANYNKDNILKVSPYGEYSVLMKNVKKPYYLYISENMLFISCQGTDSVIRYKLP